MLVSSAFPLTRGAFPVTCGMVVMEKDLNSLRETLVTLRAMLSRTTSSGDWVKKLNTAIMDADDILDEIEYEQLKREIQQRDVEEIKVHKFFSAIYSLKFRFRMLHKIRDTNQKLKSISQESIKLEFEAKSSTDMELIYYWTPLVDANSKILGRESELSEIVNVLIRSDDHNQEDFSVVGITGMGGVGKTTLSREVFNCDEVARYFDNRMWFTVPDNFEVDNLLEEMSRSLNPIYLDESNGEAVIMEKLQNNLKGKRFLLVLDDVCSVDQKKWDCMRSYLLEIGASRESKLLVTTRSSGVLRIMKTSFSCNLHPLPNDESWKLFSRIVFADEVKGRSHELVDIGLRLVEKCKGLPLAIKVVAGLLYCRKNIQDWSMIQARITWNSNNGVLAALQLSYDYLPFSVKQCFAYCSIFPKDTVIEREKIIQQWMAQGFLNSSIEFHTEMEDVGSYYFSILLQSSLFQEVEKDDYDNIVSFKIQGIVHDFAIHVARDFCSILNADGMRTAKNDAIHVSFISKEGECCEIPEGNFQKLRTLYLIGGVLDIKLTSLTHVRVLVVESFEVSELPASIGNLIHLRYLDISRTMIMRLPSSITKLYKLQTLRLYALQEFPMNFNHLISLRHLHIEIILNDILKCLIPGIRHLISLQTVPYFVVSSEMGFQIDELGWLPDLKGDLKIFGLHNIKHREEAIKANLSKKSNIQSLEFHWDGVAEESNDMDILDGLRPHSYLKGLTLVNFQGTKFPSWMVDKGPSLFCNLVHFRLDNCNKCDELPALGHLPCLKTVEIYRMNNVKVIGTSFYGDTSIVFPSLRRLSLTGMPSLVEWFGPGRVSTSVMCPKMEELSIEWCPALKHLPEMSEFASLRLLTISSCEELAALPEGIERLACLEYLGISKCSNLASIPDARDLVSLRFLSIMDCKMLGALPSSLDQCKFLESLSVLSCPTLQPEALHCLDGLRELEIGYFTDELDYFPWPYAVDGTSTSAESSGYIQHHCEFMSLTSVKLYGWPKLSSLPEQLQYLSALRDLTICLFDGLVVLPEWLCKVQTLEILELQECSKLISFPSPEAMKCLINLRSIKILYCPLLEERCIEGNRSEWEKISHVPQIYINNRTVQPQR